MEDYSKYILLKKLFDSLLLEKYNIEGEIRIIDFISDEYVDIEKTKEFPDVGGIEVVFKLDLTKYHNFFDTYDEEYNDFFMNGEYDNRFTKVLKYIGELPFYHDYYIEYKNKEALINKLPEMKENINTKLKEMNEDCFVSNIVWENEDTEKTKQMMTRLIVENTCGDNIKGVYIHELCSELYDDVVWLSRSY
jgi:hypothetical protein